VKRQLFEEISGDIWRLCLLDVTHCRFTWHNLGNRWNR
jgi:hypothetical protein